MFQYSKIPVFQYSNRPIWSSHASALLALGGQEKSDMGDFLGRSYIARGVIIYR